MANASGFFTPSVPSLRRRIQPPIGIFGSGYRSPEGFSTRVFCSSTTEGADKLASGASSSESRVPRLVSQGCKLVGCGSAVPTLKVSNDDLAKLVDTSDEWISVRTGIRNRRVLSGQFLQSVHDVLPYFRYLKR
ncbi:beta-ketoacyl-[acyl-carrier-protein] synthase III, chloroplastic [Quercus suber]|uniref:beta-ketoacyl-[acyl-carrier-protein] synthase III, chloroplastic n=1 Tax=Quercus suber TaxID=58331 RepID=UPI0032DECED5